MGEEALKRFARIMGISLFIVGVLLSALWVVLYAELCPNDPECPTLGWTDARYLAAIGVGLAMYLWGRRA